jgi:phage terminase large subunit GpA-like protein
MSPTALTPHSALTQGYDAEYFQQLTAEKRVVRYYKGFPKAEWIKTRARNEALDCRVQAHAALCLLNPRWPAIERRVASRQVAVPVEPQADEPKAEQAAQLTAAKRAHEEMLRHRRARNSWMNRWRY